MRRRHGGCHGCPSSLYGQPANKSGGSLLLTYAIGAALALFALNAVGKGLEKGL